MGDHDIFYLKEMMVNIIILTIVILSTLIRQPHSLQHLHRPLLLAVDHSQEEEEEEEEEEAARHHRGAAAFTTHAPAISDRLVSGPPILPLFHEDSSCSFGRKLFVVKVMIPILYLCLLLER